MKRTWELAIDRSAYKVNGDRLVEDTSHRAWYVAHPVGWELVEVCSAVDAVDAAQTDMARHLRGMAADPSWPAEVQRAFEYAAGTFSDTDDALTNVLVQIRDRPMPDGNASCGTELERIKQLARQALAASPRTQG